MDRESYAGGILCIWGTGAQVHRGPKGHRGPRYTGAPGALRDLRSPTGWSLGVVKMTPLSQKNIVFQ